MSTMLYKAGGPHQVHGGQFAYVIVEDDQIDTAQADGWHLTTVQATAADEAAKVPPKAPEATTPSLDDLRARATELGLKFDGRMGAKTLQDLIAAAQGA